MNEQEFRDALRATMSVTSAPPAMSDEPVLAAAHRDRRRRRAIWAGGGSALTVAAIAVGMVLVAPSTAGDGVGVAAQSGPAVSTTTTEGGSTETSWPNGQPDRTATAGPDYDRGVALLGELTAVRPDGYTSPDQDAGLAHQAQYLDTVDGSEVWEYTARVPLARDGGVGQLFVAVYTPGSEITGTGCAVSSPRWGTEGTCMDVTVGDVTVGVVTVDGERFDQRAAYVHPDGTAVFVAQSTAAESVAGPPLAEPPLTVTRLAELATDPRFDLD